MTLDAIGIVSENLSRSVELYSKLGLELKECGTYCRLALLQCVNLGTHFGGKDMLHFSTLMEIKLIYLPHCKNL